MLQELISVQCNSPGNQIAGVTSRDGYSQSDYRGHFWRWIQPIRLQGSLLEMDTAAV